MICSMAGAVSCFSALRVGPNGGLFMSDCGTQGDRPPVQGQDCFRSISMVRFQQ